MAMLLDLQRQGVASSLQLAPALHFGGVGYVVGAVYVCMPSAIMGNHDGADVVRVCRIS
jgi:hypothetical protein